MHVDVKARLNSMSVRNQGDAWGFLKEFAPMHAEWHMLRRQGMQEVGFLTFHRLVIDALDQSSNSGLQTNAASILDYPPEIAQLGQMAGSLDAFAFSEAIEVWHNGVHSTVGQQFPQFGQARVNIFLQLFWDFHAFIDEQFVLMLNSYGLTWDQYLSQVDDDVQRLI